MTDTPVPPNPADALGSVPLPTKSPLSDVTVHYDQVGQLVDGMPAPVVKEMLVLALMTLNGMAVLHQPGFVEKTATMSRNLLVEATKADIDAETAAKLSKLADTFDKLLADTFTRVNAPPWRDFALVSVLTSVHESMMLTLLALTDETFVKRCVAAHGGMLSAYGAIRSLIHAHMMPLLPRDATPAQTEQMEAYITKFVQAAVKYVAEAQQRVPS